jgi:hypothetical protein
LWQQNCISFADLCGTDCVGAPSFQIVRRFYFFLTRVLVPQFCLGLGYFN